jgi:hypothetical protein
MPFFSKHTGEFLCWSKREAIVTSDNYVVRIDAETMFTKNSFEQLGIRVPYLRFQASMKHLLVSELTKKSTLVYELVHDPLKSGLALHVWIIEILQFCNASCTLILVYINH